MAEVDGHDGHHDLGQAEAGAGAQAQVEQMSGTKAEVIVGVSCNPQTFVRDARVLVDAGWRLERVTPVDQFLWSTHVELVGAFSR